jgi:hypothetical protein
MMASSTRGAEEMIEDRAIVPAAKHGFQAVGTDHSMQRPAVPMIEITCGASERAASWRRAFDCADRFAIAKEAQTDLARRQWFLLC